MKPTSLLFSVPLFCACGLGLQTNGPLFDSGLLDDDLEPSSEPSDSDTDVTDTNDTTVDTSDTNDSDTDTDPLLAGLITSSTPLYGTTAGGDTVSINGGPFTSDATVTFGGVPGVVLSNNGSMIRANTPATSADGPVEVRVDMDDGYGIAPDNFIYFSDAIGKTATIGVVSKAEYVGTYWGSGTTPPSEANIWTAFTNPLDVHYWELSTPALNTCARNGVDTNGDGQNDDVNGDGVVNSGDFYQYGGNLTVFDIGASSIAFEGSDGNSINLTRASNDPNALQYYMYETTGGLDVSLMPDNAFYDLNVTSGSLTGLTVAQFARASRQVIPFSPNMNTSSPPYISSAQSFSWGTSSADWIEIRMYQLDATNSYIISDIICNVDDTGSFTVQNIHQQWSPGNPVYVQFSRAYESNVTMPYNDGISRVVGMYTILGAGLMN